MQALIVLVDVINERLDPLAFAFVTGSEDPANQPFQHTRPRDTSRSLLCIPAPPPARTRGGTVQTVPERGSPSTRHRSGEPVRPAARSSAAPPLASARPPWPVA